ncbi:MAG: hypothetical protein SOY67_03610 [Collinsella sp.]|nr:hypothetical protein [Collinsella sp.]
MGTHDLSLKARLAALVAAVCALLPAAAFADAGPSLGGTLPNTYDTFSPVLIFGLIGIAAVIIIVAIVLRLRKKD